MTLVPTDPLLPGSEMTPESLDVDLERQLMVQEPPPSKAVGAEGSADRPEPVRPDRSVKVLAPLLVADSLAVAYALVTGQILTRGTWPGSLADVAYVPVVILVFGGYGLYRRGRRRLVASTFPDLSHIVHGLIVAALLILLSTTVVNRATGIQLVSRQAIVVTDLLALVTVPLGRMLSRRLTGSKGRKSRVLVVGSGLIAARLRDRMAAAPDLDVIGCVDDHLQGVPADRANQDQLERVRASDRLPDTSLTLLGGLADIPRLVAEHNVDRLVVAFSPTTESQVAAHLRSMADLVQICVVPRMFDLLTVRSRVDELAGLPVIDVAPPSLGPADRFAKRTLDLVVSAVALVVLAPVLLGIAVVVKLTSPGPILFRQVRTGRSGRSFRIYKFRTMVDGAEAQRDALDALNNMDGPIFKIHHDPRTTRAGAVLRATSLDELPQLINVLLGEMSLVGPRPFGTLESNKIDGWAARRFDVRPGVTGLWQVSGRSDLPFDELQRLDYSYVASWSLWWDLRILWHTPGSVLRRSGAY